MYLVGLVRAKAGAVAASLFTVLFDTCCFLQCASVVGFQFCSPTLLKYPEVFTFLIFFYHIILNVYSDVPCFVFFLVYYFYFLLSHNTLAQINNTAQSCLCN